MSHKEYIVKVFSDKTEWHNKKGQLHRENGPAVEWKNEHKEWFINGNRHRENGPAIEWADGDKSWWINGKLHREDGPAVEYANGNKTWWINGKLHREDGPAFEGANGDKSWWINGKELSEQEFLKRNQDVVLSMDEIAKKFGVPIEKLKIKK